MTLSPTEAAQIALRCLDLTSLGGDDDDASITALCRRAYGPHGAVAAVCVWPRFVSLARGLLPPGVAVAAVVNFPHGSSDIDLATQQAQSIVQAGGQEVDLVLPYHALMAGRELVCARLVKAVRVACPHITLKVILETGELRVHALIAQAAQIAIDSGANFIKTSTGKTAQSASLEALGVMLDVIARQAPPLPQQLGIKPSGGIRTMTQAIPYMEATANALGSAALVPQRFRLGASSLLDDIEAVLGGKPSTGAGSGY